MREHAHAPELDVRIAFAGGGTGGHIVPGLHLLACVREPEPAIGHATTATDILWFSSGRAVEERVLGELARTGASSHGARVPFDRVVLDLEPRRGGAPTRSGLAVRTLPAVLRARRALEEHRSDVLLGLGGFTCLPAVLAARSLSIPVALFEINAERGQATRWLSRFAARVFHAWPATMPVDSGSGASSRMRRHVLTGAPLAPEFRARDDAGDGDRALRAELGFDPDRPLLVVLGGSQGAGALNRFVREHGPALVARGAQVLHQTGPQKLGEACPAFSGYRAVEYIEPVHRALRAATLVLCRGGASSLAEIAALERPAVVVPYPHHADRHQERNARALGAGVRVVAEAELGTSTFEELADLLSPSGAQVRAAMSRALSGAVPNDAGSRVWRELALLARSNAAS